MHTTRGQISCSASPWTALPQPGVESMRRVASASPSHKVKVPGSDVGRSPRQKARPGDIRRMRRTRIGSNSMRRTGILKIGLFCVLSPYLAKATTINVTPADSYTKIESAMPGDEVVIAPGTYRFRVYLTQAAPANTPIIIRAQDPNNRPIWDLSGGNVEDAPGSYTAGDRGRGCWQLSGATNIQISGLVIQECHTATYNSAGLRYYNASRGIKLKDVIFRRNDNGLTGGTLDSELTAEFCEFDSNGNLNASQSGPTHNIYIYGGTFALRYSYAHDPTQGQNFHIRAKDSVIEYNWFARPMSYSGDLMTDDDF